MSSWQTGELTNLQIKQVEKLMELNPDADQLFIETVIRAPPEYLAEVVRKHKAGEIKNEPEIEVIKGSMTVEESNKE
jgi:hypothetical protein